MSSVCVVGAQWGDEGKGKVVDILGEDANLVVRWQGGNNAGHTVVVGDKTYFFHAIPAGAVRGIRSLVGSEVVLDPRQMAKEIDNFSDVDLGIDPRTSIIMPWHNDLDGAEERVRKKKAGSDIGTTGRGIGPCYADDAGREGIMFYELVGNSKTLEEKMRKIESFKSKILGLYDLKPTYDIDDVVDQYLSLGEKLKKYESDVSKEVNDALKQGLNIIFEGAQGTLLDRKYGNNPYVTSSHPMSGSIFPSLGIPPMKIRTVGIVKAYITKVGSGPVVTCLDNGLWPVDESQSFPEAIYIRKKGKEKGTTTGRPRRVGWMDLVALKYTHRINGFKELALTKLDVLSGLEKIALAVAYKHKPTGKIIEDYKGWDIKFLNECEPMYEYFEGFGEITDAKTFRQLPKNVRKYIKRIETVAPITLISVGPRRDETIYRGFKKF